jgi:hypothetical protein
MEGLTLNQAKQEAAIQLGFTGFANAIDCIDRGSFESFLNKAMEIYAAAKWSEACDVQRSECDMYHGNMGECGLNMQFAPKPKYL